MSSPSNFDFSQFPTLNQVKDGIEKLKKYDWPKFNKGDDVVEFVNSYSKKSHSTF